MDLLLRFNIHLPQKYIDYMNNCEYDTILEKLIKLSHLNPNAFCKIINEYCKINPCEINVSNNYTPLQISIDKQNIEILKIMLKNGANVYYKDDLGVTILNYLTDSWSWDSHGAKYYVSAIKLLLEYDANQNNNYNLVIEDMVYGDNTVAKFVEGVNVFNDNIRILDTKN